MAKPKYVTIREAADLVDQSEQWIRKAIRDGMLPARREEMGDVHTTWLIDVEDLQIWMTRPKFRGRSAGPSGVVRLTVRVPSAHLDAVLHALDSLKELGVVVSRQSKPVKGKKGDNEDGD